MIFHFTIDFLFKKLNELNLLCVTKISQFKCQCVAVIDVIYTILSF